jgi:transcriptional regulator with XRE-family HTH domain
MITEIEKPIEFGAFIHGLRKEKKYSLKIVADKLGIDISLLSKIEHGERQLQGRMLAGLADLFELDYRALQIKYLNKRIKSEFGNEPFFIDSLKNYIKNIEQ